MAVVTQSQPSRSTYRTQHSPQRMVRDALRLIFVYGLLIGLGILFILPLLWTVSSSVKPIGSGARFPPEFLPTQIVLDNYPQVFRMIPFARYFVNSAFVSTVAVTGELLSASLVAFAFARLRFPGRNILFLVLLSTMMLPGVVTMIPQFVIWKTLGLVNTYAPLTAGAFFGPAFSVFLLRQFFLTINLELDEAAKVDGAHEFRIYWQIILPLAKPALATIGIFSFMASWNDFMGPLIYLSDTDLYTLALGVNYLRSFRGGGELSYQMAAATMFVVPCIILYFIAQRYIIQGIVTTGLKG
ncbi:MAG: carbohydrate ABC transporter permease [Anaerolineae bacterium]|nr:carbohydrate ABC transporter permease [Thermoflexales bacterium]MDW8408592.1 carbohydrate ABC transporter permease [Anaerolineae bacterium]